MDAAKPQILIVEDNPIIVEYLSALLTDEGYGVGSAWNGAIALELLASFQADLIILDMWLPVMDGETFLTHYFKNEGDQAPVVVMSASTNLADVAKGMGAVAALIKPVDADELLEHVRKHIRRSRPENL
jgi:DNA-binding response OmpR family regulator